MQDSEMNIDPFTKLKSDGDFLEQHVADRVRQVIPSYARIWAEYVGNDGNANALPMVGASEAAEKSRESCWQRLYTTLESLSLCWDIEEELQRLNEIKNFKIYAHNLNLWMAFHSHLGRVHDMVKAFTGELDKSDVLKRFDEYWKERNIVLHGPKVPMKWVYNTLAIPPLGEKPKHWNDKMVWSELKEGDIEFIAKQVSKILRELEMRLEWCLAALRKILPDKYGWKPVSWDNDGEKAAGSESEPRGTSGWPTSPQGSGIK
jgi:hypothetical protein